jgi:ribosomal protein S18 acetylase RimI-like enzyme
VDNNDLPNVRLIAATQTLPLRSAVLRQGRPVSGAVFAGDDDTTTLHLGVFVGASIVGVASLYRNSPPAAVVDDVMQAAIDAAHTWQLRGMAIEPKLQGRGYGRQLLTACVEQVAQQGGRLLWCNARTGAVGFYRAAGFEVAGPEFVIPDVGPHYVMLRYL